MNQAKRQKLIDKMTLTDDIFATVFFDNQPKYLELLLNVLLPFKVTVKTVRTQYKRINANEHCVIFDIFAVDSENNVYNIEIQKYSSGASPKRARFHSGMLDTKALKPGQDYSEISDSYVIFITEHDVLKGNKPIYRIERTILDSDSCVENEKYVGRPFNDGAHIIYFNLAYKGECREDIRNMIHDFTCSNSAEIVNDLFSQRFESIKIGKLTKEAGTMNKWLQEALEDERKEGHAEGLNEGLDIGRKAGLNEGLDKGRAEKSIEIAKNMLLFGNIPVEQIAQYCNLTVEEVNEIKKSA